MRSFISCRSLLPQRPHFSAFFAALFYIAQSLSLTLFLTSCNTPAKPLALEYLCDNGYSFSVLQSDDEATVTLHGEMQTLPRTISASGVRFATQDERYLFFSKGNVAHLDWNKIKLIRCELQHGAQFGASKNR